MSLSMLLILQFTETGNHCLINSPCSIQYREYTYNFIVSTSPQSPNLHWHPLCSTVCTENSGMVHVGNRRNERYVTSEVISDMIAFTVISSYNHRSTIRVGICFPWNHLHTALNFLEKLCNLHIPGEVKKTRSRDDQSPDTVWAIMELGLFLLHNKSKKAFTEVFCKCRTYILDNFHFFWRKNKVPSDVLLIYMLTCNLIMLLHNPTSI